MSLERSIVSITDPIIKVDPILLEDSESETAKQQTNPAVPEDFRTKLSARAGSWIPVVQLNSILFGNEDLIRMSVNFYRSIPFLTVLVKDQFNKFSIHFPLDGDVMSVYLRPPDVDNQKAIRLDFDILNITSSSESGIYSINGILKVPGLFKEENKAFTQNTTFNHLQEVSELLELGFASNVTSTKDSMIRLCPYETYETFINDSVSSSYLNDDSFFTWYIDPYYYLCLVDVNRQFSLEDQTDAANVSLSYSPQGINGQEDTSDTIKGSLVLTNEPSKQGLNIFIERYSLENNSASIWMNEGYKRFVQYYEQNGNSSTYENVFTDPLTTPGAEQDYVLLKGRVDEDFYKEQVKYKWMGQQSSLDKGGNVHSNFLFAKVHNHQNLKEINKTTLKVTLAGMNMYIYKYMRIPVLIYQGAGNTKNAALLKERDKALGEDGASPGEGNEPWNSATSQRNDGSNEETGFDERDLVKNEFLSGYYVVTGIEYTYSRPGPVKQILTLSRREWPIPAKHKDQ